ncbi:hypothetical protein M407DRAFT_55914, partial [Tulasnella calospora MUT 4182]
LNGTTIEIWDKSPTALEFARLVHISRPVLFTGCFSAGTLPALTRWTNEYLSLKMGETPVSVAVTPDGYADALKRGPDGITTYFTEPHTQHMVMANLLSLLSDPHFSQSSEVVYLQSQNGNLNDPEGEFASLREDVPAQIPWASEALDKPPEAVNLWIGDSRSITSAHSDPYENVYTVVRGRKHFTLLPPTEGWTLQERMHPHATYTRPEPALPLVLTPSDPQSQVSWTTLDPVKDLDRIRTEAAFDVHPIEVTVNPGDALYLPAGWWHHVRQEGDDSDERGDNDGGGGKGHVIALNWWYDMEMRGMSWVWLSHLRG